MRLLLLLVPLLLTVRCQGQQHPEIRAYGTVTTGAQRFDEYLPLLKNKKVAVVTNASGLVGNTSIVDTLLKLKVQVTKIFGPEHGFRGNTDAGLTVKNNKDKKTGLPVISLYGSNKKPTPEQLKDVDVLLYDIQDLGVRFYTYISTMSYVMEACAENKKEMIVLDRPNPNGFYVDGPLLKKEFTSFLGLHPVPLVYGMTTAEYALMVNAEGWLKNGLKCSLKVIPMLGYERNASYELPVKPSPNIPNASSVLLYPSLGLFEGTVMSLGRGTPFPFQVVGHPQYPDTSFCFVPRSGPVSKAPRYMNEKCYGLDLRYHTYTTKHSGMLNLGWLRQVYTAMKDSAFFEINFNYHAGNSELQKQLKEGYSDQEIRESWQRELDDFMLTRKKYLVYPDFTTKD